MRHKDAVMGKVVAGRILLSVVAIFTGVTPYLADWNATHIFNPHWTPHAKFHNAQTMAFALLLGFIALGYIWSHASNEQNRDRIAAAGFFAGLYWAAQGLAHFYPGVGYMDPEFMIKAELHPALGLTPQALIDIVVLAATVLGVWLAGGMVRNSPR